MTSTRTETGVGFGLRQRIGLVLGPICFLFLNLMPLPEEMSDPALRVGSVAALMAVWWITEAIPLAATALIPIALFPALGVMTSSEVTASYANHLIYLYLGGFIIALAIEKWNLHKRIALLTISVVGVTPSRIILGFMLSTAFLSMWISNTATTMMMLPIALAVVQLAASLSRTEQRNDSVEQAPLEKFEFGTSLMLGIAYAASIGGIATLIGTPPNAILAGVIETTYGETISFTSWMAVGLPLSAVMLTITWFYLTRIQFRTNQHRLPGGRALVSSELKKLGPMKREEKWVLAVFFVVAVSWILRGSLNFERLALIHDSTIAIVGALALFLIPSDLKKGVFLVDWKTTARIPWDIIILFGGGFALANGFSASGLTEWLAGQMDIMQGTGVIPLLAVVALLVIFLTEITSNTATASLCLPIMAAFAEAMQVHPYGLMVVVALAASFAFMMPVATPPNAIVFSSRCVSIPQMAKAGFWLNIVGCLLLVAFVTWVLPFIWGIDLSKFPVFP